MGLLSKKSASFTPSAAAVTIIAHGSEMQGVLSVSGHVHIDGQFRGEVVCAEYACVGTTGSFIGSIRARHVLISGSFEGDIDCDQLEITDTGELIGEVVCEDLVIDGGGRFSGCRRPRDATLLLAMDRATEPGARGAGLIGTDKPARSEEEFADADSDQVIA